MIDELSDTKRQHVHVRTQIVPRPVSVTAMSQLRSRSSLESYSRILNTSSGRFVRYTLQLHASGYCLESLRPNAPKKLPNLRRSENALPAPPGWD
jgi:hypothetical protein